LRSRQSPRTWVTFRNKNIFYGEEFLAPRPTPNLEDHSLLAARGCLFNIFSTSLHMRRQALLSVRLRNFRVDLPDVHGKVFLLNGRLIVRNCRHPSPGETPPACCHVGGTTLRVIATPPPVSGVYLVYSHQSRDAELLHTHTKQSVPQPSRFKSKSNCD
jgi:hypothetical protein